MVRPVRYIGLHPQGFAVVFPVTNQKLNRVVAKSFPEASLEQRAVDDVHTPYYWFVPESEGVATRLRAFAEGNEDKFEFTEAAKKQMERELADAEATQQLAGAIEPTQHVVVPDLLLPLFPYQLAALEYGLTRERLYIADDMGAGKTAEGMCYIHMHDAYPCIVVCPANARSNWEIDYKSFLGDAVKVRTLMGRPSREGDSLRDWVTAPGKRTLVLPDSVLKEWLPLIRYLPWKSILVDEMHRFRKRSAQRSRSLIELGSNIPRRVALSGTPVERGSGDLKSQLRFLGVEDLFRGYVSLEGRGTPADDLALNRRLAECVMIRRKKEQFGTQLPEKDITWRAIDIDERQMATYSRAEDDFVEWTEKHEGSDPTMPMGTLRRLVGEAKVDPILEWLEPMWLTDAVPLLFCYHHSVMDRISHALEAKGIGVIRYHGQMTKSAKEHSIQTFQKGEGRCMVAQIQAAGIALNLQRADTVVFAELDWLPTTHSQAYSRAHRTGSKHERVIVRYLWTPNTIDEDMRTVLNARAATIGVVVDGDALGSTATLNALVERRARQGPEGGRS